MTIRRFESAPSDQVKQSRNDMEQDINSTILARLDRIERLQELAVKTVLTVKEVCTLTGLSESRIHALCSSRDIPHYKQGKTYFKRKEVEDWMTANRQPTRAETESKAAIYCHTH